MDAHPRRLGALVALAAGLFYAGPSAAEQFRLEKQFDLAAGDRFVLVSELGQVSLRGVAGRRATILVTSDRADLAERYDFRFEHAAGRLRVVVERKDKGFLGWFRSGHQGRAQLAIEVPRATPVELDSSGGGLDLAALDAQVKAQSSGGSVKIADVHGDVHLESSGGGVRAQNIDGALYANSSGGSITLDGVTGDIQASGSGGGIEIAGAGGQVRAGSSGGPVHVAFAAGNSKGGDIDSSGGGVVATLDGTARVELDAASSGGSVHCDLPVTIQGRVSRDSLHGKLNGGGAALRLRSSGGGIAIKPL